MSPRAYTLGLFAGLALAVGTVAAFNRVVDPFWFYRDVEIAGFNAAKPRFARFERHVKPQLLVRDQPQAIVFGSSLAEIGFDANDPSLTDGGRLKGYNFAFAGVDWAETQCYFLYALGATDLKRAVIGIHPGPLPRVDCVRQRAEIADFSQAPLLLSLRALQNSVRTVLEQGASRASHTREGRYLYTRGVPGAAARFGAFFRGREKQGCTADQVPATPPPGEGLGAGLANSAATVEPDLEGLRMVIRAAREKGVALRLAAYPHHALALELDFLCGTFAARWAALAAIARVVEAEAPDGSVQLWAFYDYNAVTGERVVGREPAYWQDPDHFNHEMGALLLADLFGTPSQQSFGRRLTTANMAEAQRALLASRARFLAAQPAFYDDLRATLAPLR